MTSSHRRFWIIGVRTDIAIRCLTAIVVAAAGATARCQDAASGTNTGPTRAKGTNVLRCDVYIRGDSQACLDAARFVEKLAEERGGIEVRVLDVLAEKPLLSELQSLCQKHGVKKPGLPAIHACGQLHLGFTSAEKSGGKIEELFAVHAYVRSTCPHCRDAKRFLAGLAKRWPAIRVELRDVEREQGASARMTELAQKHGVTVSSLPGIYLCGRFIAGYQTDATTGKRIEDLLRRSSTEAEKSDSTSRWRPSTQPPSRPRTSNAADISRNLGKFKLASYSGKGSSSEPETPTEEPELESPPSVFELPPVVTEEESPAVEEAASVTEAPEGIQLPWLGYIRVADFGLPAFTLITGLLDGFNPCAMWVLVFLLSVLVNVKDRFKIAAIAVTFVLVSGLAYFAFMAAWLNVFVFLGVARPLQIAIGVLALFIGAINVKDFFAFKKGLSLSIPESAKPGIYRRAREIVAAKYLSVAIGCAVVLAIVVNTVELLCTAGLPALYTQILSLQDLPAWKNYAYLGLYNVAYIFDDSLLVVAFVTTLSHRKLQEAEGRWLKLISGLVVLALGMVVLFWPDWLHW